MNPKRFGAVFSSNHVANTAEHLCQCKTDDDRDENSNVFELRHNPPFFYKLVFYLRVY